MKPIVRGTGAINSGTGTITVAEPTGTANGDLQLMFCETDGAETPTCTGWTNTPNSPQTADTVSATDTKLSILYRIRNGAGTLTTNDPGDHIVARIMNIIGGTFNASNPFNTSAGSSETTSDTSASIPGAVTTVQNCLIVVAVSSGFDPAANNTTEFSIATNSNLTGIVEQIDDSRLTGNGGGFGVSTGYFAGPGDYGASSITLTNASLKGLISLAIEPAPPTALPNSKEQVMLLMATGGFRKLPHSMSTDEVVAAVAAFKAKILRWRGGPS